MTGPLDVQESEEALVALAVTGDSSAFTQLYDRYYDRVYRHLLYRLRRTEDAEDLTQQVFLQAWRAVGRYRPTGAPFAAWLFTIAHNLVVSFYRHHRLELEHDEHPDEMAAPSDLDPEQRAEITFDQERLRRAIAELKAEQQLVVTLRFLENLPHRDIAVALGKSEGAVRVIQHRALQDLRRILEKENA